GLAGGAAAELLGELDALGFAAAEGGGALAELDVAEADGVEGLQFSAEHGDVLEEGEGLGDAHLQDVGDVLALVADFQGLAVVSAALADFAGDVDVRQEVHLDLDDAVAFAGLAAAAFDVEGEAADAVAPGARFRDMGEEFPQGGEQPRVG